MVLTPLEKHDGEINSHLLERCGGSHETHLAVLHAGDGIANLRVWAALGPGDWLSESHPYRRWRGLQICHLCPREWPQDKSGKWPVILFLHGYGEAGDAAAHNERIASGQPKPGSNAHRFAIQSRRRVRGEDWAKGRGQILLGIGTAHGLCKVLNHLIADNAPACPEGSWDQLFGLRRFLRRTQQ
jgi:hypothetical protein